MYELGFTERRGSVFLSIHARFPLSNKANRCISVYFCLCNRVFVFVYLCLCIRVEPCRETRQCIFAHSCWAQIMEVSDKAEEEDLRSRQLVREGPGQLYEKYNYDQVKNKKNVLILLTHTILRCL